MSLCFFLSILCCIVIIISSSAAANSAPPPPPNEFTLPAPKATYSPFLPRNPCTRGMAFNRTYTATQFNCTAEILEDYFFSKIEVPIIPILASLFIVFTTIFVCLGRYCCNCCGSYQTRPDFFCFDGDARTINLFFYPFWRHKQELSEKELQATYFRKGIMATRFLVVASIVLAAFAVSFTFTGIRKTSELAPQIRSGMTGFTDFVTEIAIEIEQGFNPYRRVFGEAFSLVQLTKENMDDLQIRSDKLADDIQIYTDYFLYLGIPVVAVGVSAVFGLGAGLLSIRKYLPVLVIGVTALFCLPIGVLGGLTSTLKLPLDIYCNEVDAQLTGKPGIFQNFLVPNWCQNTIPFKRIKDVLETGTDLLLKATCKTISESCSPGAAYDTSDPLRFFRCESNVSFIQPQCNSTIYIRQLLDSNITVKSGIPRENCNGCSVATCATDCTNSVVQSVAEQADRNLRDALQAIDTVNRVVTKYLDCNVLINKLLSLFDFCSTLGDGVTQLSVGFGFGLVCCATLITSMFLGQKRFFRFIYDDGMEQGKTHTVERSHALHTPQSSASSYINSTTGTKGKTVSFLDHENDDKENNDNNNRKSAREEVMPHQQQPHEDGIKKEDMKDPEVLLPRATMEKYRNQFSLPSGDNDDSQSPPGDNLEMTKRE